MSKPQIVFKNRINPLLKDLPDFVKAPENYMKIERALLDTLICRKAHAEIIEMAECRKCTTNMLERRALMKTFGFKTSAHYMTWKKIHRKIQDYEKVRLSKYNKK